MSKQERDMNDNRMTVNELVCFTVNQHVKSIKIFTDGRFLSTQIKVELKGNDNIYFIDDICRVEFTSEAEDFNYLTLQYWIKTNKITGGFCLETLQRICLNNIDFHVIAY